MLPAFQTLVDAHWRDVARLAHALAGPVDGDDVAQQAWMRALDAYPRLTDARNLRSWLLTVTAHCATDEHRSRGRRAVPVEAPAERPQIGADPAETLMDEALWAAVRGLPDRQRMALTLRYVADLDHAQIASALETTQAATRRLVSDALRTLRAHPIAEEARSDDE